jgi:hypothetical protein
VSSPPCPTAALGGRPQPRAARWWSSTGTAERMATPHVTRRRGDDDVITDVFGNQPAVRSHRHRLSGGVRRREAVSAAQCAAPSTPTVRDSADDRVAAPARLMDVHTTADKHNRAHRCSCALPTTFLAEIVNREHGERSRRQECSGHSFRPSARMRPCTRTGPAVRLVRVGRARRIAPRRGVSRRCPGDQNRRGPARCPREIPATRLRPGEPPQRRASGPGGSGVPRGSAA